MPDVSREERRDVMIKIVSIRLRLPILKFLPRSGNKTEKITLEHTYKVFSK